MKPTTPAVSVVIPAYNQAPYLAAAIESALAQTFTDREIIVVDDGSTDQTAVVVQAFGDAVRYLYQANQGLASARNTGIRHAQGELIALLDSDDAWCPDFLARMVALAAAKPRRAVFYSGVCYVDAQGRPLPQRGEAPVLSPTALRRKLLRSNFLVPSAMLMRRAAVIEAGLFDTTYRRLQDWELWVRMLRLGYTFAGLADGLVRYRIHEASLSTDPDGGEQAALALAAKHLGPDDELYQSWEADKRTLYGGVYRYVAITSSLLRRHDWARCARFLRRALLADPTLATDLDLFYELALGPQPLGQRTVRHFVHSVSRQQIQRCLAELCGDPERLPSKLHDTAHGTAFFALGLASYHGQDLSAACQALQLALHYRPALLHNGQFLSTLLRTFIGRSALSLMRQVVQRTSRRAPTTAHR